MSLLLMLCGDIIPHEGKRRAEQNIEKIRPKTAYLIHMSPPDWFAWLLKELPANVPFMRMMVDDYLPGSLAEQGKL